MQGHSSALKCAAAILSVRVATFMHMSESLSKAEKIEDHTGSSMGEWAGTMDAAGLRDLKQSEQVQMLLPLMKDRDESQRLLWARRIASEYRQL
ncbi:hypothetical protein ATK23_3073 [Glutamicibacter mysorens]|uniref:Uncharacterized protein n=2 Tax=Micrococcaceae TaxID=1268 RepID=A0ABX4N299_9MICC|nr:hypothetical protein ATK23_3073 [Glutamicibacter mysorens]